MVKEIEIPEGYKAKIENNKVIFVPKESEDERIRKAIEGTIRVYGKTQGEWLCGYDMDTLVVHLREAFGALKKQKEQQPAEWSEEDKRMIDNIIYCLPRMATGTIEMLPSLAKQYALCLKSLFPSWKPSEQEKGALRTAIHILTEERNFPKTGAQLQNILNAFEDKESRKDWKPSEEQMEILQYVCTQSSHPNQKVIPVLESLYNDLKKL